MEILLPITAFLFAPFAAWWALSFWIIIPCTIALIIAIGAMVSDLDNYDRRDDHPVLAFFCLLFGLLLTSIGIGYKSTVNGFWPSTLESLKFFTIYASAYVGCGVITLMPLWYVNVRRMGKSAKKYYQNFISAVLSDNNSERWLEKTLTEEQKTEVRECNGIRNGKILPYLIPMLDRYKSYHSGPRSLKASDNMGLISSLIFLWPLHIIIEIFGEFIAKIPEHVVKVLRLPLNLISKYAVRGIPNELK